MMLKAKGTYSDLPLQAPNWAFSHFGIKTQESKDRLRPAATWLAPLQPHVMSLKLPDGSWAECSTLCSRGLSGFDVEW